MKAILALALILGGIAAGGALGHWLRGKAPEPPAPATPGAPPGTADAARSYVSIGRQFIVPVVEGGETRALMLFEVALDVPEADRDLVLEREPRLRDAFLRELFGLAQTGAFLGSYTDARVMEDLRAKLLAAARLHLENRVDDVLILDALRQETRPR